MAMYIYDKENKIIYHTDRFQILNSAVMDKFYSTYGSKLDNFYGEEVIEQGYPKYKPYKIDIIVDKDNNVVKDRSNVGVNIPNSIKVSVDKEEYYTNWYKVGSGQLFKYFNDKFYIFTPKAYEVYDAETNTLVVDKEQYRKYIIGKIKNSEQEVRDHGYYYSFWDDEYYLQPFRVTPDNDLQVIKSLRYDLTPDKRAIKLFVENGNKRDTRVGTYKWLKGQQVIDAFLDYHIQIINAYSGYVKDAINEVTKVVEVLNDLDDLKEYEINYVKKIIKWIADNRITIYKEESKVREQIKQGFKQMGIKPLNDILL